MEQTIRAALDALVTLQEGLSITDPVTASIGKAYKYFPDEDVQLPDGHSWLNEWSLTDWQLHQTGLLVRRYTIHMQLFVQDADLDQAADIASAFEDAFHDAIVANVTLDQTVNGNETIVRGGTPTLATLVRGTIAYVGLDLFLDVEMKEGVDIS